MFKPSIGISACLSGSTVRYDGGHKLQPWFEEGIARWINVVAVCPEVGAGLSVPRPAVRLSLHDGEARMVGVIDRALDVTAQVSDFVTSQLPRLADIDGYIVKARSPSCGRDDTPIFEGERVVAFGAGMFTRALRDYLPLLPISDEICLSSAETRGSFFDQVYVYRRWRDIQAGREAPLDRGKLEKFGFHAQSALSWRNGDETIAVRDAIGLALAIQNTGVAQSKMSIQMPRLMAALGRSRSINPTPEFVNALPVAERYLRFGV